MIAIIDYEAGNLDSVYKAVRSLKKDAVVTSSVAALRDADKLILPGVGNFKAGIQMLRRKRLDTAIIKEIARGKPFLGICLGMQLLFASSEEASGEQGLGVFPGTVKRFIGKDLIVPHMGWNSVKLSGPDSDPLFKGIEDESFFYFAHSFYCPKNPVTAGTTEYGTLFSSYLRREALYAVQFHPEKSQRKGLKVLRNFCGLKG